MDNQFCRNCGQANFPNANACTKCGNALNQAGSSQSSEEDAPPPTIMAGQPFQNQSNSPNQAPQKTEKKSNKMFWIAGIAGVLLILGIGVIGIIGVGAFLYVSSQNTVEREYPVPPRRDKPIKDELADKVEDESPLSDLEFPSTGGNDGLNDKASKNGKITNDRLISFFKVRKSRVGSFRLQSVINNFSTSKFPERIAGVIARYKKGKTRLTHNFAAYDSNSLLKQDFAAYKRRAKSSGGRITKTTATSIIYIKGSLVYFAFHNPEGGFHEMSSRNGKDILKYHNDYFGVK